MRIISLLFWLPRFLLRLLVRPFQLLSRRRLLSKTGWLELHLEGSITEARTPSRLPSFVLKRLGREEGPQVVLTRLRQFVEFVVEDPKVEGLLVRLGPLRGGWASADEVRQLILRMNRANKRVIVQLTRAADNKTFFVGLGANRLLAAPTASLAPVGAAAATMFYPELLEKAGIEVEVASAGRFKSAPDAFTRTSRSEADLEQTRALVDAIDGHLIEAVSEGRKVSEDEARALIDRAPYVGAQAKNAGLIDGLRHDEDVPFELADGDEEPPGLVAAGRYLSSKLLPPLIRRRKKVVGVVQVHGAIVEKPGPYGGSVMAVEREIVAKLRAALANKQVGAVVLHVNSRGGGVTPSDAICAAVRRVNLDKPVIACFGDVAASGGYYVACGATSIVASPLTVTGSIGVFAMLPIAERLKAILSLHMDVVKSRTHADLYNLWRKRSESERVHIQAQIDHMYESFVALVAEAREMDVDAIKEVAEGRVWTGKDAHTHGLVDGLGGMAEAIERAKEAAGGKFEELPVLVRTKRSTLPRPTPRAEPTEWARRLSPLFAEAAALWATSPHTLAWAYAPIEVT